MIFDNCSGKCLAALATSFAFIIAEGRTNEELNILGNFFAAVGGILSVIASVDVSGADEENSDNADNNKNSDGKKSGKDSDNKASASGSKDNSSGNVEAVSKKSLADMKAALKNIADRDLRDKD